MTWSKAGFDISHTACLEHVFDTQLWGSNLVHSGSTLKFQFSSIRNILELGLLCEWTGTPNLLNYGPQCIMCFSIILPASNDAVILDFRSFVKIMAVSSLVKLVDPYVIEHELVFFFKGALCHCTALRLSLNGGLRCPYTELCIIHAEMLNFFPPFYCYHLVDIKVWR